MSVMMTKAIKNGLEKFLGMGMLKIITKSSRKNGGMIDAYLVSLCIVCFPQDGQCFFISNLSFKVFLFFLEK
jgi:hypothetical protein